MRYGRIWLGVAVAVLLGGTIGRAQQPGAELPPLPLDAARSADEPVPLPASDGAASRLRRASVAAVEGQPVAWGEDAGCACFPADCDCATTAALAKAAAGSHKVLFYDNDFSYLCDDCYDGWRLGDRLKRLPVGDRWTVDVGGQYRMRFHSEQNFRNTLAVPNGQGLTGADDDFLLHRTRFYVNAEYGSRLRFYGEMLDAVSELETGITRVIEENRTEPQNLFLEVRDIDVLRGTVGSRVGRQELLYGNQRMVSPLDWANTRRTFDAGKVMYRGENWDVDAFFAYLLRRDFDSLDPPHQDRQMYGVYATYKNLCRDNLELFWLALDFNDVGFRFDTVGGRYWGGANDWLYELEAGYQFGENADGSDHSAGAFTLGLGRKFECAPFSPTLWAYYDWASGDDTVGNGWHHYQPLAHKYLGFMDLFGRRNIEDANLLLTAPLTEKLKLLVWYHYFRLQNGNDVPYNISMLPFAGLPAGSSGSRDLGHEIDVIVSLAATPRSELLVGYSHFFAGDYYATSPVPFDGDADFVYVQWETNF